jgi:IMP dehydrogenase
MGILHKNMSIESQSQNVRKVKKFETGMVIDPVTISPEKKLSDALELMKSYEISGIPVVDGNDILLGILTNRDVRFAKDMDQNVRELMTSKNLVTVKEGITSNEAQDLLHKHRIEKLLVVDNDDKCIGLITVKDIEKSQLNPNSSKDNKGRLMNWDLIDFFQYLSPLSNQYTYRHCQQLITFQLFLTVLIMNVHLMLSLL